MAPRALRGPAVTAPSDFSWSGGAPVGSASWSEASNWAGGTAPSGTVGTLSFPTLTSSSCTAAPPTSTCYTSTNDLTALSANAITVAPRYAIGGNAIALGSGGLSAAPTSSQVLPGTSVLTLPIQLRASQTWTVDGGFANQSYLGFQLEDDGNITGAPQPLAINLKDLTDLTLGGENEVGPVTITAGEGGGSVDLGTQETGGSLNNTDSNPISVSGGAGLAAAFFHPSAVGPLTVGPDGGLQVGQFQFAGYPAGALGVGGSLTLSSTSAVSLWIDYPGTSPGADYSQISALGPVNLAGAQLRLFGSGGSARTSNACPTLEVGDVDTLLTTTSTLTGTFANAPDGTVVSLAGCQGVAPTVRINYTPHAVTATVLTGMGGGGANGGGGVSAGGSSPSPSSCGSTSSSDLATAFAALVCQFVHQETGISTDAAAVLGAVGTVPHAVQSQIGTTTVWVLPSSGDLSSAEVRAIESATDLLKEEIESAASKLLDPLAETIEKRIIHGEIPCAAQAWQDISDAISSDEDAVNHFATAAQTVQDLATAKLAVIEAGNFIAYADAGAKDLIDKLNSLNDALTKDAQGCFGTDRLVLAAQFNASAATAAADSTAVQMALQDVGPVPVTGVEIGSPPPPPAPPVLPIIASPPTPINVLNLPGVNVTPLPTPPLTVRLPGASITKSRPVRAGRSLSLSGSGFAARTRVEILLSDTGIRAVRPTGSTGSFTTSFTIPVQTANGRHTLYAIGTAASGGLRVLTARIEVRDGHLPAHPQCVGTLSHITINGGLVVRPGIPCTLLHVRVRGAVTIGRGAVFEADFSTIRGNVLARKPTAFTLCGDHVYGRVSVNTAGFPALIGAGNSPLCPRTKITRRVTITR